METKNEPTIFFIFFLAANIVDWRKYIRYDIFSKQSN